MNRSIGFFLCAVLSVDNSRLFDKSAIHERASSMMRFYFGSTADNLHTHAEYDLKKFAAFQQKIAIDFPPPLFFLKQTHSNIVHHLNKSLSTPLDLFQFEGDAIVTQERNIAIGVVTADCLPLILYDPHQKAVGVIHAGWRGLHAKIISATILKMKTIFNTTLSDLKIHLGPSASVCCYEVQPDFLSYFPEAELIEKREDKLFFNPKKAALLELASLDIADDQIDIQQHTCTICTEGFCSVRKAKEASGRQPSIVMLV